MKLVLNKETCEGHGRCIGAAPGLLAWDMKGEVSVSKPELTTRNEIEAAEDARDLCPTRSLRVE